MNILAGFDIDPTKVNQTIVGVPCYHIESMRKVASDLSIDIAILTTSPDAAQDIAKVLIESGVKGILNFTSVHLDVPKDVYLKDYDIVTSLEEIGFFIKPPSKS